MGHPMRLELTRVGLLVKLANRYTTKGTQVAVDNTLYTFLLIAMLLVLGIVTYK